MDPVTAMAGACLQDVERGAHGGVRGCWPRSSDRTRLKQRIHPTTSRFTLTAVQQGRAANFLQNLRISDIIKADVSKKEALYKVFTIITHVAKKPPREFSGDAHREPFMRGAVIRYPWEMQPLSRQDVQPVTFQELYGELHASLSLKTDAERAVARDCASSAADTADDAVTSVYFRGQDRYAITNTGSGTRLSASSAGEHGAAEPPRLGGCWNCEDKTHRLSACPAKAKWERAHKQRT